MLACKEEAGMKAILESSSGRIARLEVRGKVSTREDSEALREAVLAKIQQGYRGILILMEGVEYLSDDGMGRLAVLSGEAGRMGGKLVLVAPRKNVRRFIRMTGVERVLSVKDTESEALALLQDHLKSPDTSKPG